MKRIIWQDMAAVFEKQASVVKIWDIVQQAGGPVRIKNRFNNPEDAAEFLYDTQEKYLEKVRAKFPDFVPVPPAELLAYAQKMYSNSM
jgi:hypothetical protein